MAHTCTIEVLVAPWRRIGAPNRGITATRWGTQMAYFLQN
jgi:hypothetical protein